MELIHRVLRASVGGIASSRKQDVCLQARANDDRTCLKIMRNESESASNEARGSQPTATVEYWEFLRRPFRVFWDEPWLWSHRGWSILNNPVFGIERTEKRYVKSDNMCLPSILILWFLLNAVTVWYYTQIWKDEKWMINSKRFEGAGVGLIDAISRIKLRRKSDETSFRLAEIWNWCLPNTRLRYTNLLGSSTQFVCFERKINVFCSL
jgi:hypothetical protein